MGTTMYAERCASCPLMESSRSKRSPSAEELARLLSWRSLPAIALLVERLGNPVTVPLTGGTEVIAFVNLAANSPTQSFTLTTSIAPQ